MPAERKHEQFVLSLGNDLWLRGDVRVIDDGQAKPVVIVSHGFKGFKDWGWFPYVAESLAERGFGVISFNYSRNGVNETDFDELEKFARNTYSRDQEDLAALYAALLHGELPLASILNLQHLYLVGHSRGGGSSIVFADEHPTAIRAVATWNSNANPNLFDAAFRDEVRRNGVAYVANARTKQQMPIRADFFDDLERSGERFNIAARAGQLITPLLVIQGDRDSERILSGNRQLRESAQQALHITIAGADHTFNSGHPFVGTSDALEHAIARTAQFFHEIGRD
ncbi:alpha/beta hydrolase family protein [Paenibacillus sp. MMS18-CY102]|uniref:alpha/beta hydrolase family protein n=1 Tax=Paenibacillus sp. MMS18-CY102 TaxID=2682849 RepID=UPI001365C906|nr:alpha/beta fold hydrolase [Paenibacillus sp. MMS18-CY102]MWC28826.1 alpha/beta fold hydrolase [Paenibacillus sp. MMS18-CY102]